MSGNTKGVPDSVSRKSCRYLYPKTILPLMLLMYGLYFIFNSMEEHRTVFSTYLQNLEKSPRQSKKMKDHRFNPDKNTIEIGLSIPSGVFNVSAAGLFYPGRVLNTSDSNVTFLMKSVVTEDVERRKQVFSEKYVECKATTPDSPLPFKRTCGLKLPVADTARDSVNFAFLQSKIEAAWQEHLDPSPSSTTQTSRMKTILYWVQRRLGRPEDGDHDIFVNAKCPETNCQLTANRHLVPPHEVDAIILNSLWIPSTQTLPSREKYVNAKMILQVYETPDRHKNPFTRFDGLVDYTMGYRKDSDFPATNGFVRLRQSPVEYDAASVEAITANKSKMAAWFVSNCASPPSGRMTLTKSLQKYGVEVDIYGKCGSLTCPSSEKEKCYKMLEKNYKFYFSFENSLCNHYVTEKFYNVLRYQVVPVTYGLGHEITGAPKDAYIDVFDFPDVKSLAAYLTYLHHNDTAYNEYFKWKQLYESTGSFDGHDRHCKICEMLVKGTPPQRQYPNTAAWVADHQCLSAQRKALKDFIQGKPGRS